MGHHDLDRFALLLFVPGSLRLKQDRFRELAVGKDECEDFADGIDAHAELQFCLKKRQGGSLGTQRPVIKAVRLGQVVEVTCDRLQVKRKIHVL